VLAQPKDVELLLGGVPVRTDTLKDAGAVLQRVGRDRDLRVAQGRELSIEVGDAGLDDLLSDRRDLVQPLLDRARHDQTS